MSKSKFKKSELTAKERKQLRTGSSNIISLDKDRTRFRMVVIILLGLVACGLIFAGIYIPIYYSANYLGYERPIAVFEISDGNEITKLEYEIFINEYPNVANNFLFLASIGYFDGNIIYDNTNNWIKFGGYYDLEYNHRSEDKEILEKVKNNFDEDIIKEGKQFKYSINPSESKELDYSQRNYLLTGIVGSSFGSATEFQFSCSKNNKNPYVFYNLNKREYNVEAFAAPISSSYDSCEKLFTKILNIKDTYNRVKDFSTPLVNNNPIILKSVKVYNYDAKWDLKSYEHGFQSFMEEQGGFKSTKWTQQYIAPVILEEDDRKG